MTDVASRMMAGVAVTVAFGCGVSAPAKYRQPMQTYRPPRAIAVRVEGFEHERFRVTGEAYASHAGAASGPNAEAVWGGHGSAVQGQYVTESAAEQAAVVFANTGCFSVIAPSGTAPTEYTLRGRSAASTYHPWYGNLEAITLLPVFGVPVPDKIDGAAQLIVYREDGTLVRSFESKIHMTFPTTIYTFPRDEAQARDVVSFWAVRDVVEQAAAAFCGVR